ncbi:MAG: hypothetical protein FJZ90_00795 [Chloroflexi bacterium]|nr:hypothetical protein [Chloroflexota bacterium]
MEPTVMDLPTKRMPRLSAATHSLAERALSGEHGRAMRLADLSLADCGNLDGLSADRQYARVMLEVARRAPLRVEEGQRIVGASTYLEAPRHLTPVLGTYSTSHTTVGFDRVLRIGYRGLRQRIQERLGRGDLDERGADFLQALLVCLEAASIWHARYVRLLEERIRASSGEIRATYERALDALRNVPEHPATTFHEAVQSLWFQFAFQRLCGNWSGIGRIDEMLGPYLQADLAAGRITLDEARELLAHLWINGCEWIGADIRQVGESGDAQHYQNVILSGVDAAGNDITNEVTYLVLDVVEELRIADYPIAVRISSRTPERLLRRVAEAQRLGGGIVAIYNEEMVIRALARFGYPLEEARSFANDGCWEVLIPGKTTFAYRPFDMFLLLQQALGVSNPSAPPPDYSSFDALYAAFLERLRAYLDAFHAQADDFERGGRAAPAISLLVEDCIEKARGYHDRGARYVVFAPHAGGLPDAANSLLAIKTLVFEEQRLSLPELVAILRDDWEGHEALRRRMRSGLAYFGNDNPEADAMVRRVFDDYVRLAGAVHEREGVLRPPGLSTFGRQIEWAEARGATAAGTRRGEYLANNFSPSPGSDREGPTAVIKSVCAVDFETLPNGTALELKIHPSGVKGEAGMDTLVALMRTFVALGGWFLHIDVVDSDMLRDAQRHPERYANLAVRVSGWSARFATLSPEWQEMIIQRTEQEVR